jgi:hypothetical protein
MSKLTLSDIGVNPDTYICMGHITNTVVIETERIGIQIIGLPRCSNIPLHDHPNMLGFSYLLHGTVNIYQMTKEAEGKYVMSNMETVNERRLLFVTPNGPNYHKLEAFSDSVVFDVFIPNYNDTDR